MVNVVFPLPDVAAPISNRIIPTILFYVRI